jgi:hypothetical protein
MGMLILRQMPIRRLLPARVLNSIARRDIGGLAIPNVVCHHNYRVRPYVVTTPKRTSFSTQSDAKGAPPIRSRRPKYGSAG